MSYLKWQLAKLIDARVQGTRRQEGRSMGATRSAERQVVLRDGVIYVAFDRFVCSSVTCAGSTAVATGRDIDGHKLREVDAADLAEWAGYGLGAMRCECGRVVGDHPERS